MSEPDLQRPKLRRRLKLFLRVGVAIIFGLSSPE